MIKILSDESGKILRETETIKTEKIKHLTDWMEKQEIINKQLIEMHKQLIKISIEQESKITMLYNRILDIEIKSN